MKQIIKQLLSFKALLYWSKKGPSWLMYLFNKQTRCQKNWHTCMCKTKLPHSQIFSTALFCYNIRGENDILILKCWTTNKCLRTVYCSLSSWSLLEKNKKKKKNPIIFQVHSFPKHSKTSISWVLVWISQLDDTFRAWRYILCGNMNTSPFYDIIIC